MFSSSGVQIDFCRVCYIRYFTYGWTSFNAFTKLEAMQMHNEAHGNCHHNFLQLYLLKNELEKPSLRPRLSRLMFNLDIPLYFHGNTVLIVVILVFRDARVMPVIQG